MAGRLLTRRALSPAAAIALVAAMLAACTEHGGGRQLATDERGVAVVITGRMTEDGMCPWMLEACAAIAVQGDVELPVVAAGQMLSLSGWYDGRRLLVEDAEVLQAPTVGVDFTSMCPQMHNDGGSEAMATVLQVLDGADPRGEGHPDVAAVWWDDRSQVITVWFARNMEQHRPALEAAAAPAEICLVDGAPYSDRELRSQRERVRDLVDAGEVVLDGGSGVGRDRVDVALDVLDQAGREALADLPAVRAIGFIELLDRPLDDLPPYRGVRNGTVDVLTDTNRPTEFMAALFEGFLRYDPDLNCLYLDDGGGAGDRMAVIWPLGTVAAPDGSGRVTVYTANGGLVASDGDRIALGGGTVDVERLIERGSVIGTNTCGASEAWG